jgi:predicted membrane channel-forming protein YqfA (hemolysin III family)
MLADTTWDFGDFILAMLSFFFFVIWIWLLIMVFSDIFRRHDIGGGTKTLWVVFVFVVPYFGAFIYLISQGRGMAERAQQTQAAAVGQVRNQMGYSVADELEKLDRLHQQGSLNDAEYQQARAQALG